MLKRNYGDVIQLRGGLGNSVVVECTLVVIACCHLL